MEAELVMPPRTLWLTFFRQWLKNPRSMASAVPSGRQLGAMMVSAIPERACCIVELGAGTGAITAALVRSGVAHERLLIVEMNPVLHGLLQRRFPQARLAHGDARNLSSLVARDERFACKGIDAVVSSLGLLNMPRDVQRDIVGEAFTVMREGGVLIQYTYGREGPLDDRVCHELGLRCKSMGWAWRNLPPAKVFVYRKERADA